MAIRYDKSLMTEIRRVVRNFNAKRRRLEKQGRKFLPDKVTVEGLKGFTRRRELKTALNDLRQFSKKGAENLIDINAGKITKWEYSTLLKRSRRAKISLSRRIKDIQEREKTAVYTASTKEYLKNLQYQRGYLDRGIKSLSKNRLRTYEKILSRAEERKMRNEVFYENFFDMLFKEAYVAGVDPERLEALEKKLRELTPEQLADAFNEEPVLHNIVERYKRYVGVDQSVPYIKFPSEYQYRTIDQQLETAISLVERNADRIVERYKGA